VQKTRVGPAAVASALAMRWLCRSYSFFCVDLYLSVAGAGRRHIFSRRGAARLSRELCSWRCERSCSRRDSSCSSCAFRSRRCCELYSANIWRCGPARCSGPGGVGSTTNRVPSQVRQKYSRSVNSSRAGRPSRYLRTHDLSCCRRALDGAARPPSRPARNRPPLCGAAPRH
jgi:hypothetical protein